MFHVAGLVSCAIIPIVMGMSLVIPTPMGARDKVFIGNFWKFVEKCRITFLHAVPTTLGTLAQNPPVNEDVSSLRDYATTGSTALPVDVARTIEARLGIRLLMTYGATEFTQNVTQAPRDGDPRYGCAGIRNPYTEIRIVELDGNGRILRECVADEIGAVIVRSPGNTPGYVDPVQNQTIFLSDGWINNGDLGRLDADGYLWLTGRAKDLIIRGGHNIDPAVIEDALRRHPAVALVAAIGQPDAYAGELPVAYVQLREGASASEAELIQFAQGHISERAAVPKEIHILAEMPLTDIRKLAKAELRKDAVRRVFDRVLRSTLGPDIEISVMPHDVHGIAVTVTLPAIPEQGRPDVERSIDQAVRGFATRVITVWK
jgi:fatty-acyl-CoA synthase